MADSSFIPYGRQSIDEADIEAVVQVLKSDWLTTGPAVAKFEAAVAEYVGATHAIAVANGTAGLHAAMFAIGVGPGDEVIVPPLTFAATANAVLYQEGTPVFADVEAGSLLLDAERLEQCITPRTKAVIAVDYAGQPCDYQALRRVCEKHDLILIADACHSLGATYQGQPVGTQADLTIFSFHPVKPLTTGEGGMVVTENGEYAQRLRRFRNHGISTDHHQRAQQNSWQYQMTDLGFNYRLTDLQSALGLSQLAKLPGWIERRTALAAYYRQYLTDVPQVRMLTQHPDRRSGWHLLVVRVKPHQRDDLFHFLRRQGIGANVHYGLVYRHPYYRDTLKMTHPSCPVAEQAEQEILTLPLFPGLREQDLDRVCQTLREFFAQP